MVYFQTKKFPFWVNFGGLVMEDVDLLNFPFWYILQPIVKFYGHLVHFVVIWYIFHILVCCIKKNLATLLQVEAGTAEEEPASAAQVGPRC
jgi:hypothetical protein